MDRFIILRKHLLVNAYIIVKDDVTEKELKLFIQQLKEDERGQFKFVCGSFLQPTLTYEEDAIADAVKEESKDGNLAQKIFNKWSQGSVFDEQNNQGAV